MAEIIGVIGGTGLTELEGLQILEYQEVETPLAHLHLL